MMIRGKRPSTARVQSKQSFIVSSLVIALTLVIALARAGAVPTGSEQQKAEAAQKVAAAEASGIATVASAAALAAAADPTVAMAGKPEAKQLYPQSQPQQDASAESQVRARPGAQVSVGADEQPKVGDVSELASVDESAAKVAASAAKSPASTDESDLSVGGRKGRAEAALASTTTTLTAAASEAAPSQAKETQPAMSNEPKAEEKPAATPSTSSEKAKAPEPKASAPPAAAKKPTKSQLTGKSGSKSKLPPNLGTVTSTGSGGPAHYLSRHDAYSAIAEKHGALAPSSAGSNLHKSDKRNHLQGFGGIQKASGFGDALGVPFKGVGDSGLARTLGASMRSIMKSKFSVPAYVASALLGAVALMAFYESPISPLPVPALPEPPVGRFPPEMPILPTNAQVPYRGQQQQQYGQQTYNQRSLNVQQPQQPGSMMNQQPQQVLFPVAQQQPAQQRQINAASQPSGSSPVQQLAANLLGNQPSVQRKSGIDYEYMPISSRSLFGSSIPKVGGQLAVSQQPQKASGSFLSWFGLGGASQSSNEQQKDQHQQQQQQHSFQMPNHLGQMTMSANGPIPPTVAASSSSGSLEPKGQSNGLSSSNIITKFKSFFTRSPSSASSSTSASSSSGSNSHDQSNRLGFMQSLIKDASFLPAFLNPSRKSTPMQSSSTSPSSNNKLQGSSLPINSAAATLPTSHSSSSRAQSGPEVQVASGGQQQLAAAAKQQQQSTKPSGGYGFMRAADRIAHALLETFSSGIAQRNSQSFGLGSTGGQHDSASKKSSISSEYQHHQSPLVSATSLLTDIMTSYGANVIGGASESQSHEQLSGKSTSSSSSQQQQVVADNQQAAARSDSAADAAAIITFDSESSPVGEHSKQPTTAAISSKQQVSAAVAGSQTVASSSSSSSAASAPQSPSESSSLSSSSSPAASSSAPTSASLSNGAHVRKTRSIGLYEPIESQQELPQKDSQQPSRAAQINNVIDFVADSYSQNRILFNFFMNQVGLSQAVPYVEQILASGNSEHH